MFTTLKRKTAASQVRLENNSEFSLTSFLGHYFRTTKNFITKPNTQNIILICELPTKIMAIFDINHKLGFSVLLTFSQTKNWKIPTDFGSLLLWTTSYHLGRALF